jgi:putative salt-induced outer membrane protein YdiY
VGERAGQWDALRSGCGTSRTLAIALGAILLAAPFGSWRFAGAQTPPPAAQDDRGPALPGPDGAGLAPDSEPSWQPPVPDAKEHDWIRLKSGEWLKGDVDRLRSDELTFDSDELDELDFDWDDVMELRSPRIYTYVFERRVVAVGTALIRDGVVAVRSGEEVRRFERDELVSIVTGAERERDYWDGKVSLGATVRSGNTNQQDFTGVGFIRRAGPFGRFRIDYNGAISVLDDVQNTNNHRLSGKLDIFLSKRFYVTPVSLDAFKDRFQNIEIRVTPSAGLGYSIIDRKKLGWEVELGGGAQYTRFTSTPASGDREILSGALVAGSRLEWDLTKRLELDADYSLTLGVPEVERSFQHFLGTFSFELTNLLDFDVTFNWDWQADPVPGADGEVPKKSDFRLSLGLGIEF